MLGSLINSIYYDIQETIGFIIGLLPFILIFILAVLKIYFGKTLNNKLFSVLFLILLIWSAFPVVTTYYMVKETAFEVIPPSFLQLINQTLSIYSYSLYPYILIIGVILAIIISCVFVINCIKTKSKENFLRYILSICVIILALYIQMPFVLIGLYTDKMTSDSKIETEVYKKSSDISILPPVKHYITFLTVSALERYIYNEAAHQKFPDFKSDKLQQAVKDWGKYSKEYANLDGSYNYISDFLKAIDIQNEEYAQYIINKLDESSYNTDLYNVFLYIYRGDYENALKYIKKLPENKQEINKLYSLAYLKNKDYNNALYYAEMQKKEDEKNAKTGRFYIQVSLYIAYKENKLDEAQRLYSQLHFVRSDNDYNYTYTLDEYIKYWEGYKLLKK